MQGKPSPQITSKIKRIKNSLDAIECGRYSDFDIYQCCDYIGWLARFRKVPREVWLPLCEQATQILESGILLYM